MAAPVTAETPYRVLIAHQSTIPHYRVRFYELVEEMRPKDWNFDVVFDTRESDNPRIYAEPVDYTKFKFPILDARTYVVNVKGHKLVWQQFFAKAMQYDFIVTDTHITNLTYPAVSIYRLLAKKWILWGHPRDMNTEEVKGLKVLSEAAKKFLIKRSSAFFAYTESGRVELLKMGYPSKRIFVMNNTIDTAAERNTYVATRSRREAIRSQFGVTGKKVLLYVGRLMAGKRIGFLLEAFQQLVKSDPTFRLFIVGSGDEEPLVRQAAESAGEGMITCFGSVTDRFRLAPIFIASDLYIITGMVGLAPLQALCYDLPVIYFDTQTHGPEVEYLTPDNSVRFAASTPASELAAQIPTVFQRTATPEFRSNLFSTIEHLTIKNMAQNFVDAINNLCEAARPTLNMSNVE